MNDERTFYPTVNTDSLSTFLGEFYETKTGPQRLRRVIPALGWYVLGKIEGALAFEWLN